MRHGLQGQYPPLVNPADLANDFLYVDDCTRAFVTAALTACRQTPGRSYNIGTGVKTTLGEVAETARGVFQIATPPAFGSMLERKWDLPDWYGNPARAKAELGWSSRVSFHDGLAATAAWEKEAAPHVRFAVVAPKTEKLTAVIACYRDHEAIPIMHERLTKVFTTLGVDYEIIFVNDRSPADDEAVIRELCETDPHVLGVSHSRNFGSQSAFLSGMELASGDAVILLDGDLQDTPETIEGFYPRVEAGLRRRLWRAREARGGLATCSFSTRRSYRVLRHLSRRRYAGGRGRLFAH